MASVGVFCGFSAGRTADYRVAARDLGTLIGQGGHRLIYGGGSGGLMGEVAAAACAHGATAFGVVPRWLRDRDPDRHAPGHPIMVTEDLFERKRVMIAASDGFIALPGGFGTLDEVLDVISMRTLGVLSAPLALLDVAGGWQPFLACAQDMRLRGFLRRDADFAIVDTPTAALAHVLAG